MSGSLSPLDPTFKLIAGFSRTGDRFEGDLQWRLRAWVKAEGERGLQGERVDGYTECNAELMLTVLRNASIVLRGRNLTSADVGGATSSPGDVDVSVGLQVFLTD